MTVSPLRLGIVGGGSLTERGIFPHLSLAQDRVRVTALCDVSRERLSSLAGRFAVNQTYTDISDLLGKAAIDAVAVATPIQLHYRQAEEVLEAGYPVYVQKTMAETGKEARDLHRRAEKEGLTLAASPGQMALPAYARAKERVDEGQLGRVFVAVGITLAPGHETESLQTAESQGTPDPSWYYQPGGGPLRDMGVYALHAITGILGPARGVTSLSSRPLQEREWRGGSIPVGADDNVVLGLDLPEDRLGVVSAGFSETPAYLHWGHLAISGSEGALEVRRLPERSSAYEMLLRSLGSEEATRERFGTGLGPAHDALDEAHVALDLLDFVDAVREDRPPLAHPVDAIHVIDVIEASETAAKTGRVQTVPPPPARFERSD